MASPSAQSIQAMDSNQLLSLCERIRNNMNSLEKSIRLNQLRLTTLSYIQEDVEDSSLKCFDNLIELSNLSQLIVLLLDELHLKLSESSESSIDYQIASQQLTFFTSEWYDNFTPKLNETFELASRQDIKFAGPGREAAASTRPGTGMDRQQRRLLRRKTPAAMATTAVAVAEADLSQSDMRIRDALLRLKQSMRENERLTASIASNIEYTRATIETIYDSLQSTKLGLDAGERQALEATGILYETNYCKFCCYLILLMPLILLAYFVIRWISKLFAGG